MSKSNFQLFYSLNHTECSDPLVNVKSVILFIFQVPSVLFAPSHLMAIMTLGINSALVMDCGYTETLVLPVSFYYY